MRMSADLRDLFLYEAFLYYNPLLLVVSYLLLYVHHAKRKYLLRQKISSSVCIFITVLSVLIVGTDDLVMGSKLVGLCAIISELCQSI